MISELSERRILTTICLLMWMIPLFAQQSQTASSPAALSHLPLIMIDTHGQTIVDEPKITVDIKVIDNGTGKQNSTADPGNQYDGLAGIEIRGQSSQMFPKKSYGLELRDASGADKKAALMGMPSESDWVLYAPYSDKTMIRNAMTYYLGRRMGRWQPGFRFCELYLNGSYQGVYQLTEKIKRDKDRVDVDKLDPTDVSGEDMTGGYIVKVDKVDGSNYFTVYPDYKFQNAHNIRWTWYYPEYEDLTTEQQNYFKSFVKTVENTINGSSFTDPVWGYARYLDILSFIDFQIVNELGNNVDGYRYSTYFHKENDEDGGKLNAGPLWDFDLCYGNLDYSPRHLATDQWSYTYWGPNEYNCMHWWYRLMQDPNYVKALHHRWTELRKGAFSTDSILAYMDGQVSFLGEAINRNFSKWPILSSYVWPNSAVRYSYSSEISFLKNWVLDRLAWMDANWMENTTQPDTIPQFEAISVYPNPVADWLTIELPRSDTYYTIRLTDLRGAQIFAEMTRDFNSSSYRVNLKGLGEGLYLLTVVRPGIQPVTTKIIRRN